jgi:ankyrin repeat protein
MHYTARAPRTRRQFLRRCLIVAGLAWLAGTGVVHAQLVEAVKAGDREAVTALLRGGIDVDKRSGDGSTALLWASYEDDLETVQALIRAGADVNAANDLGATPIWAASRNGSVAMARTLLEANADPNAPLLLGEAPIVTAARSGSAEIVELLLLKGAEVNARGARGQTPLMFAASQRHPEVVKVLLAHGADVNARSHVWGQVLAQPPHSHVETMKDFLMGGNTALMFAVQSGDLESAKLLVAAGADVNKQSAWGFTPLTVAVYADFGSAFRVYEGDVLPLNGERGIPGQDEFRDLVYFLLDAGADPNVGANRFTALHAAILRENEETVRRLLDKGADPNLKIGDWTPVERGNPADYIHKSWVGATPLWLAARFSTPEIVGLLLERGADPKFEHEGISYGGSPGGSMSQPIPEKSTVLIAALRMAGRGNGWNLKAPAFGGGAQVVVSDEDKILDIVRLLVGKVDINAVNHDGKTAIVGALEAGYDKVAELLAASGATMPAEPVQRGRGGGRGRGGP